MERKVEIKISGLVVEVVVQGPRVVVAEVRQEQIELVEMVVQDLHS
jgi:hypothetical protein